MSCGVSARSKSTSLPQREQTAWSWRAVSVVEARALAEVDLAQAHQPVDGHRVDAMLLLGHMLYVSGQKEKAKTILLESSKLGVQQETLKPYLDFFQPPITPAR